MLGEESITLYPIHAETLQLTVGIEETEAVAVNEAGRSCYGERVAPQFLDRTHKLAHRLRSVKASNIRLSAMSKVGGIAAIERPVQIGLERIGAMPLRSAAILVGMTADDIVEPLTVCSRHVLHIADVLQAAFNLE